MPILEYSFTEIVMEMRKTPYDVSKRTSVKCQYLILVAVGFRRN